jgi:tetratricopeptide (TPR) repeat protein
MAVTVLSIALFLQASASTAAQHLHAGVEADKIGQFDTAVSEFNKATELDPKLALAFVNLGGVYIQKRDFALAVPPLKHALELDPNVEGGNQLLGYALLAQGYSVEAVPYLEKAPDQSALGIALLDTGRLTEAVTILQQVVAKNPNDPDLLYYYGRASGLLSKQVFDTLEARFPDSARAHQMMAQDYAALREVPSAEREFKEALRIRPQTPGLHLDMGYLYAHAQQWDKAEEQFKLETQTQPGNAEAAYRLGEARMQLGKFHEARLSLVESDKLRQDMPETLYMLGKAASQDNDDVLAIKSWTHLLNLEKETPLAAQTHFGLAGIYRKQGKTADADRELELFRQLQGSTGQTGDSPK